MEMHFSYNFLPRPNYELDQVILYGGPTDSLFN